MVRLTIRVGGHPKSELLARLQVAGIQLNTYANEFIGDDRFVVSGQSYAVSIEIVSLASLGLVDGGTYAQVLAVALAAGLHPCAPEVGPYLRLQMLGQAEDHTVDTRTERGAPYGSITVVSPVLSADDEFPQGLYLRRLDGKLWLRGYRSWQGHVWSPEDVFALSRGLAMPGNR